MTIRMGEQYVQNGALTQAGYSAFRGIDTLTADVAALAVTSFVRRQAAVAAASQTSIDFTGIPAWVNRVTVMLSGLSTTGTSPVMIRLGDSGGIETTGYLGSVTAFAVGLLTENFSSGFTVECGGIHVATALRHGAITIQKITGNTWAAWGSVGQSQDIANAFVSGSKALSDVLTQIRVTTVGGTDTFDAGSVNISWE
jgi:hypothetical protein